MNLDIFSILRDWPYEPGQINARIIKGADGEQKIQVRLDLGLIQMNYDGRPDGQRPFGYGSMLEYFEARHDEFQDAEAGDDSKPERFILSADDCKSLKEEANQYYHRYLALLVLEEFDGVIRDTTRNLRLIDFVVAHAETEGDRTDFEQFRAYVTMIRTRAMASQALKDGEPKSAVLALDEGLEALRMYFANAGTPQMFEESGEVQALRGMREALVPKLPVSQKAELRARLQAALSAENYELAAILRDELKQMKE